MVAIPGSNAPGRRPALHSLRGGEVFVARVGRGDDGADGFLVESLEAPVPLKIFQMAAECAFLHEFFKLLRRD